MRDYHTQIELPASTKKVWGVLTNYEEYPNWNPLVRQVTGDIQEGGRIRTEIIPLKKTFSAKLLSYKPNKELVWQGKLISRFLLSGKHYYRLTEKNKNSTFLEHGEYFTGLLSYLIPGKLIRKMEQTFVAHNTVLKTILENEE